MSDPVLGYAAGTLIVLTLVVLGVGFAGVCRVLLLHQEVV